jgi:hypothetical protein
MRPLSSIELLEAWEKAAGEDSLEQSLILLEAASDDLPKETLGSLSIGQRDSLLLTMRELTFGSEIVSVVSCSNCKDRLELAFNVAEIRASPQERKEPFLIEINGYEVCFRLPNSLDLRTAKQAGDVEGSRRAVFERCVIEAGYKGEPRAPDQLPPEIVNAVAERMAALDPQADVQLDLNCPACGNNKQVAFDISSFFWSELNAWAQRVLREVHALASAYGWPEAEILSMSARRRQLYIEMINR